MKEYSEVCILTGDLVRSTDLSPDALSVVFDHLEEAAQQFSQWQTEDPRLTRFRGDGWQLFVPDLRDALRAAVMVKAAVMSAGLKTDTRIAIGCGDARIVSDDLSDASGSAFIVSGRLLDAMGPKDRLSVEGCNYMGPVMPLLVELTKGWTQRQAEIVFLVIKSPDPMTFAEMGIALGISRQAAQKRYEAAGIRALLACFEALRKSQSN